MSGPTKIPFMDVYNILSEFNEGTEIGDAVELLLSASKTLYGLGEIYKAHVTLLTAEDLISQTIIECISSCDYQTYSYIPECVFNYFKSRKLSEKDFLEEHARTFGDYNET